VISRFYSFRYTLRNIGSNFKYYPIEICIGTVFSLIDKFRRRLQINWPFTLFIVFYYIESSDSFTQQICIETNCVSGAGDLSGNKREEDPSPPWSHDESCFEEPSRVKWVGAGGRGGGNGWVRVGLKGEIWRKGGHRPGRWSGTVVLNLGWLCLPWGIW